MPWQVVAKPKCGVEAELIRTTHLWGLCCSVQTSCEAVSVPTRCSVETRRAGFHTGGRRRSGRREPWQMGSQQPTCIPVI